MWRNKHDVTKWIWCDEMKMMWWNEHGINNCINSSGFSKFFQLTASFQQVKFSPVWNLVSEEWDMTCLL